MTDLILHLGMVHRLVSRVIGEQMQQPPHRGDLSWLGLAEEWLGWLPPARAPQLSPVPAGLLDWFHDGAADLQERFRATGPHERVWTWSAERESEMRMAIWLCGKTYSFLAAFTRACVRGWPA